MKIVFWHGSAPKLVKEILKVPGIKQVGNELHYTGTLDDFAKHYSEWFIVNTEHKYIAVTQYSSWGATLI